MKNSIAILAISSLLPLATIAQTAFRTKDTLRFAADSSYSRAIVRYNDRLVFGTSKTGVISYDENTNQAITLIDPVAAGEFRDVIVHRKQLIGMVSGDNGILMAPGNKILFYAPGVFFDDLTMDKEGPVVLGDPVNGVFYTAFLRLDDSITVRRQPAIQNHAEEACYAASGTTAAVLSSEDYCFVSGGKTDARFHKDHEGRARYSFSTGLPMAKGEGAGPFSLHFTNSRCGVIVGGNYLQPKDTAGTCVYTSDGGKTWTPSQVMPNGYRSCVTGTRKRLFCCGTTGIDVSRDGGKTWQPFDTGNYCALLLEKKRLYATTNKGTCIRYRLK